MIHAAICPYTSGYCGVIVAEGIAAPFSLVSHTSIPVGHLEALPVAVRGRTMRRAVSDIDLAEVARQVRDALAGTGATVAWVDAYGALGGRVVASIRAELSVIGVTLLDAPSIDYSGRHGTAREIVRGAIVGWPSKSYANIEFAGAALVRSVDGYQPAERTAPTPTTQSAPRPAPTATEHAEPTESRAPQFVRPCRAAFDPGSSWLGVAIVDATNALVHSSTIEVGHDEPLAKPKVIQRADGSTMVRATRRVMSPEDVENSVASVDELLRQFSVTRVLIEWVTHVRMGENAIQSSSIATAISKAQWLGGGLHLWCAGRSDPDIEVRLVTARDWVAPVTRKARTKGRRGEIAPVVEARWPALIGRDEHQRDAAGMLLLEIVEAEKAAADAARVSATREPKAPCAPKQKRVRTVRKDEQGRSAAQIAREAAGCTCTSRRHRVGCPLYKTVTYKIG